MLLIVTIIMLAGGAMFIHSMFVGAPFLPSRHEHVERALRLLDLKPGQHLLELGSGDGRVLIAAARQGVRSTGYEINPLLFAWSWLRTRRYRQLVTLVFGSYWNRPLHEADGIYVYLLQPYMTRLHRKLEADLRRPTKVLSFVFVIPDKEPVTSDRGLFLYDY
jgi:SAM-dependent methyltransferase